MKGKRFYVQATYTVKGIKITRNFTFEAKDKDEAIAYAQARLDRTYPLFTFTFTATELKQIEVD